MQPGFEHFQGWSICPAGLLVGTSVRKKLKQVTENYQPGNLRPVSWNWNLGKGRTGWNVSAQLCFCFFSNKLERREFTVWINEDQPKEEQRPKIKTCLCSGQNSGARVHMQALECCC